MSNESKALRGLWGANRGPKISDQKRKARKIVTVNLEPENNNNVKGWKANR